MSKERLVFFLTTGDAHAAYLAVALHSLRRHWAGPIWVYAFPESLEHSRAIAYDPRIGADLIQWQPEYTGKNCQEFNKIQISQRLGKWSSAVYMDADTITVGPIDNLHNAAEMHGMAITQFGGWTMNVNIARGRVERLKNFPDIEQQYVEKALDRKSLAFNSGVYAAVADCPALPDWQAWTYAAKSIYISGETALHAVFQKHHEEIAAFDDRFNCSPKHRNPELLESDIKIWHGHGDSFNRPNKCQKGVDLWLPEFFEVMERNIGKIQDWIDKIPNGHLQRLRASYADL